MLPNIEDLIDIALNRQPLLFSGLLDKIRSQGKNPHRSKAESDRSIEQRTEELARVWVDYEQELLSAGLSPIGAHLVRWASQQAWMGSMATLAVRGFRKRAEDYLFAEQMPGGSAVLEHGMDVSEELAQCLTSPEAIAGLAADIASAYSADIDSISLLLHRLIGALMEQARSTYLAGPKPTG